MSSSKLSSNNTDCCFKSRPRGRAPKGKHWINTPGWYNISNNNEDIENLKKELSLIKNEYEKNKEYIEEIEELLDYNNKIISIIISLSEKIKFAGGKVQKKYSYNLRNRIT
tara:strand:- start:910 stop:1242 length:333 start_codon:yes stop_codon:yes gene_type:complete